MVKQGLNKNTGRFKFADKKQEEKKKANEILHNSNWIKISKLLKISAIATGNGSTTATALSTRLVQGATPGLPAVVQPVDKETVLTIGDFKGITRHLALDCEMVGVSKDDKTSALARCSIVNYFGNVVYDKFILPESKVYHYRTEYSGINEKLLASRGITIKTALAEIYEIIGNYTIEGVNKPIILIGHDLKLDLKVLFHPKEKGLIRDTAYYQPLRTAYYDQLQASNRPSHPVSLKKYCKTLLGISVQEEEHDSVEDAQAAMALFRLHEKKWEKYSGKKKNRSAANLIGDSNDNSKKSNNSKGLSESSDNDDYGSDNDSDSG